MTARRAWLVPFQNRPFWNDFRTVSLQETKGLGMCESCVEIDARIDLHRQLVRSTTDPSEIERINRLIAQLYADRVRLHKNPE